MSASRRLLDGFVLLVAGAALAVAAMAAKNAGVFGGQPRSVAGPSRRVIPEWRAIIQDANWIGPSNAKAVIAEFADFECPACQRLYGVVDSLRLTAPDRIAIAFVHYPLVNIHRYAFQAALLAECSATQGRFPEMYGALFTAPDELGRRSHEEWAREVAVPNRAAFRTCMQTESGRERVERHVGIAKSLRLAGTPTFAVNGVLFPAGTPFEEIADSVRAALAR